MQALYRRTHHNRDRIEYAAAQTYFGEQWFPLANNVEKMYRGTERTGLGMAIYQLRPGDTFHAQGSSYLGVVLEEVDILDWNGKSWGKGES